MGCHSWWCGPPGSSARGKQDEGRREGGSHSEQDIACIGHAPKRTAANPGHTAYFTLARCGPTEYSFAKRTTQPHLQTP